MCVLTETGHKGSRNWRPLPFPLLLLSLSSVTHVRQRRSYLLSPSFPSLPSLLYSSLWRALLWSLPVTGGCLQHAGTRKEWTALRKKKKKNSPKVKKNQRVKEERKEEIQTAAELRIQRNWKFETSKAPETITPPSPLSLPPPLCRLPPSSSPWLPPFSPPFSLPPSSPTHSSRLPVKVTWLCAFPPSPPFFPRPRASPICCERGRLHGVWPGRSCKSGAGAVTARSSYFAALLDSPL